MKLTRQDVEHIAHLARKRGLGISQWVTTGNECDIDVAETLDWMVRQPETNVIMAYAEGVRDRDAFVRALERARKAHSAFVAGTGRTAGAVSAARGSRAPADAWIAAQLALANLQSLRSEAVIAQADLDLLFAEERLAEPGPISPTAQALTNARAQVDGWVDEQNRTIARLAGQLGS